MSTKNEGAGRLIATGILGVAIGLGAAFGWPWGILFFGSITLLLGWAAAS